VERERGGGGRKKTREADGLILSAKNKNKLLSKPLEKLMYNKLLLFLKNILTTEQHGFMEFKSTEPASHSFMQSVQEALDKHLHAVGIFLDLSKACDVINHNRLLDKLDSFIHSFIYLVFQQSTKVDMELVNK